MWRVVAPQMDHHCLRRRCPPVQPAQQYNTCNAIFFLRPNTAMCFTAIHWPQYVLFWSNTGNNTIRCPPVQPAQRSNAKQNNTCNAMQCNMFCSGRTLKTMENALCSTVIFITYLFIRIECVWSCMYSCSMLSATLQLTGCTLHIAMHRLQSARYQLWWLLCWDTLQLGITQMTRERIWPPLHQPHSTLSRVDH